jgi:hypothetical protein
MTDGMIFIALSSESNEIGKYVCRRIEGRAR